MPGAGTKFGGGKPAAASPEQLSPLATMANRGYEKGDFGGGLMQGIARMLLGMEGNPTNPQPTPAPQPVAAGAPADEAMPVPPPSAQQRLLQAMTPYAPSVQNGAMMQLQRAMQSRGGGGY